MPTNLEILTQQYRRLEDKLTSPEVLAEVKYCKQYPDLDKPHVIALIEEVTRLIMSEFIPSLSCGNDEDKKENVLKIRRAVTEDIPVEERREKLEYSLISLHVFAKGNQGIDNLMKQTFQKHKLSEENWEAYVEVAKQITKNQAHQITEYVYSSLPNTARYISERENTPTTFAERVLALRESTTETTDAKQKKSVRFADEIQSTESPESLNHHSPKRSKNNSFSSRDV